MRRIALIAFLCLIPACRHYAVPPQAYAQPADGLSPADRSEILHLLPPMGKDVVSRTFFCVTEEPIRLKADVFEDVRIGDVVVTDESHPGGSTSWVFRRIDGHWTKVVAVGDIH